MKLVKEALCIGNGYFFEFKGGNLWFFNIWEMHEFSEEISSDPGSHDYDNNITEDRKWQRHRLLDQGHWGILRPNKIYFIKLRFYRITYKVSVLIFSNLMKKLKVLNKKKIMWSHILMKEQKRLN